MTGCTDVPESVNADAGLNSRASIAPPARAATDRLERIDFDMTSSVVPRRPRLDAIGSERRLNRAALSFMPLVRRNRGRPGYSRCLLKFVQGPLFRGGVIQTRLDIFSCYGRAV